MRTALRRVIEQSLLKRLFAQCFVFVLYFTLCFVLRCVVLCCFVSFFVLFSFVLFHCVLFLFVCFVSFWFYLPCQHSEAKRIGFMVKVGM